MWQYDALKLEVVLAALGNYLHSPRAVQILHHLVCNDREVMARIETWTHTVLAEHWFVTEAVGPETYLARHKPRWYVIKMNALAIITILIINTQTAHGAYLQAKYG